MRFRRIFLAGLVNARNVFRITFYGGDCEDYPILTAWDNYEMNTANGQIFLGTSGNGFKSMVLAIDTTFGPAPVGWAYDVPQVQGGDVKNRLRGFNSYLRFARKPVQGQSVTFQLAYMIPYDVSSGGFQGVLGIHYFGPSSLSVVVEYNKGLSDDSPDWEQLNFQDEGESSVPGLPFGVFGGEEGSTESYIVPVRKPRYGEKIVPQYWVKIED